MARLYPPNIAGTLPSFYKTLGTTLVVPFSMNVAVSALEVKGLRVRIKETATDITLAQIDTTAWGETNGQLSAKFDIDSDTLKKMVVGSYYKVQLAYYQITGGRKEPGYYSTVAIVKYTDKPVVGMVGLHEQVINTINSQQLIGSYSNADETEKVYQYKFQVYSLVGEVLEDSGWLLHNTYTDTELNSSTDTYIVKRQLHDGLIYNVQYHVISSNGLEASSTRLQVTKSEATGEDLNISLCADLDYDNGRVKVFIPDPEDYAEGTYEVNLPGNILQGTFILSRASSETNYQNWEILSNFRYQSDYRDFVYWDYTVAAGVSYCYALQRYNSSGAFSKQQLSNRVLAQFEDIFLFDGTRQLKVRYNPKISSFKEIVQDTKKVTLGSQFPFILRNGNVNYKEFPINGLLSYLSDNDRLFMSKEELELPDIIPNETDITDVNIAIEKNFKIKALSWLNNGGIKLFRSPQEGNYIVRLMSVSLSPNDTLSRMLHTFSSTATQVAEFNIEKLEEYSLTSPEINKQLYNTKTKTIYLNQLWDMYSNLYNNQEIALNKIKDLDLSEGLEVLSVEVKYVLSTSIFDWGGEYSFVAGIDGSHIIERDTPAIAPLKIKNPVPGMIGQVILTYIDTGEQVFDQTYIKTKNNYVGYSIYGPNELDLCNSEATAISQNLLSDFNSYSFDIEQVFAIKYDILPKIKTNDSNHIDIVKNQLGFDAEFMVGKVVLINVDDEAHLLTGFKRIRNENGTLDMQITTTPIKDYDKKCNLYFGDDVLDITELTQGGTDYFTSIPRKANGECYLAVGPGVLVEAYFQGSFTKYADQYDDNDLQALANSMDKAYENYLKHLFELREATYNDGDDVMIYDERRMFQVTRGQWEVSYPSKTLYASKGFNEALYSEEELAQARAAFVLANKQLDGKLEALLKKE